ncbi:MULTISPECIES: cation diffusion facilitator family transporter [unclassified Mucilaginibacter]|uniref:cation diffusion facilitator family transporter n=1 Tax=unclassified Mucilaginibacter TaxID=2617802 RepID=UPI002AC906AF|nr:MULTISPECIES: cation diffusion facilitator family transporter [unclassified Mucilaginibacter]MEB0260147.1 cation diffusion facilitator family transporter [Mucilaginibacter sp. 10I4]MEB0279132.1 cation diffusion facilitator family transporter [Mucilaginibacter sp. 10B2]MEB0302085.1 cation diffusion facilitator family transporter [Mucilaginibacter sp. 5C4]WPX22310.1 cation diffusion facilitator family transporter [Mucilaginibacter sp. 5C4]
MKEHKRIILMSLITGVVLMVMKFGAYFLTNSNFVLTDAAESIVNVVASSFAFFSIYLASQPRDENHPYGHGKVEYFSVFIEGALIGIAGVIIIAKSTYSIFYPEVIHDLLLGAIIIGVTGTINGGLGYYMIRKGKLLRSITIEADGHHLLTDTVTSCGLVIGLLLIYFTKILWLDSVLSILVGFYILFTGYKLIRRSVAGLMDETDFNIVSDVVTVLGEQRREEWIDIHNLRAQKYGNELHIDCHLTLPNYFDLNRVHEEVKLVEQLVNKNADILTEFFIHTDPCLPDCCHYCSMPNCPIRSEAKTEDIPWTMDKVMRNKKHYE